ncbi:NADPH-dependent FMN reductase [Solicola gregarius]|uniref:NAD(P)H-dependent oxidoreductase n=1 Tax=Solicola gregarius TaxID=2908642 RepID=A0AA46YJW4_9ACTN|nr:NAD(P)H-dependent oxidoreductase [Solicola gregarius]UYM05025.1 NAD(P)H-dependent oxidoreductase [Solicola gregarius]
MPKLSIIIASTRPGRFGPTAAAWFSERATAHGGFEVETVDLATLDLPLLDEPQHPSFGAYTKPHTQAWSAIVDSSDAFVFVLPEYNYSLPASLKNAVDYLFAEWAYKPVGFVGYGVLAAGTRAVEATKQVMTALRMMPASRSVAISLSEHVDEDGALRPTPEMDDTAEAMLDEILRLSHALATLREPAGATT